MTERLALKNVQDCTSFDSILKTRVRNQKKQISPSDLGQIGIKLGAKGKTCYIPKISNICVKMLYFTDYNIMQSGDSVELNFEVLECKNQVYQRKWFIER